MQYNQYLDKSKRQGLEIFVIEFSSDDNLRESCVNLGLLIYVPLSVYPKVKLIIWLQILGNITLN